MSAPDWSELLPSDAAFSAMTTEELGRVSRLADCEATTIKFGISAIGQLIALTAGANQLSQENASAIGWLLASLGILSERLSETENGVDTELRRREKAA